MTPNFLPDAASAIALLVGLAVVFVLTMLALRLAANGRQLTAQLRASLVQAERLATHDPLVDLPNRSAFRKALEETPLGATDGAAMACSMSTSTASRTSTTATGTKSATSS